MGFFDSIRSRGKDELKPIVQKVPLPVAPPRVGAARPAPRPVAAPALPAAPKQVPPPRPEPGKPVEVVSAPPPPSKAEPVPPAGRGPELSLLRQAVVLQARGDHEGAVDAFSKVLAIDPHCVEAYAGRGISREQRGDLVGARADYARSIEIEVRAEIQRQARSLAS